jgi:hypothetical protein
MKTLRVVKRPSERDLEVQRLVRVEQLSTREVAALMKLSQTRVCQIVGRVDEFLMGMEPTEPDPGRRHQQVCVAETLAVARLESIYQESLNLFRQSYQTPEGKPARGDVRYVNVAMRAAVLMSKMPARYLLDQAYAEIADAEDARLAAEREAAEEAAAVATEAELRAAYEATQAQAAQPAAAKEEAVANEPAAASVVGTSEPATTPTKEDCSAKSREQEIFVVAAETKEGVSAVRGGGYGMNAMEQCLTAMRENRPVQWEGAGDEGRGTRDGSRESGVGSRGEFTNF